MAAVEEYSCLSALDVEDDDALFCQKRFPMDWGLLKRYSQVSVQMFLTLSSFCIPRSSFQPPGW